MSKYQPKITTTKRDGKTALWVNLPDGNEYNLGDVDKTSPELLKTAAYAFECGWEAQRMWVQSALVPVSVEIKGDGRAKS
jgi:hypothetical protein